MQSGKLTIGTSAVRVPITNVGQITIGMRLLARAANSGSIYLGSSSGVTTSTGILVPKGDPGTTLPLTVPAEHFQSGIMDPDGRRESPNNIWLISDGSSQDVDWSLQ